MGDLALGLVPNLGTCRVQMSAGVRFVFVLVEHVKVGSFSKLRGTRDGPFGGTWSRSQVVIQLFDIGPKEAENRPLFGGDGLRQRRREGVAVGVGHHR